MFRILSVGRNCEEYLEDWHDSIVRQVNTDWICHLVLDMPDDKSPAKAMDLIGADDRFRLTVNLSKREYMAKNNYDQISTFHPNDIVVCVDPDDHLYHLQVLNILKDAYEDDIWLTYGNYQSSDGINGHWCKPLTEDDWKDLRHARWKTSSLKTFKASLFHKIHINDFLDHEGNWFKRCTDRAMMYPMLEMAGPERVRFLDRYLYWYNARPNEGREEEIAYEEKAIRHIAEMPPYTRID